MKLLTEKEKEEVQFIDTAIQGYDNELAKHRNFIKKLLSEKQKYIDIRKRLLRK